MKNFSFLFKNLYSSFLFLVLTVISFSASADSIPVRLHPDNNHYLEFRGNPTVVVTSGEQYGSVVNPAFDYMAYLDELESKGLNYTRVFTGTYVEVPVDRLGEFDHSPLKVDSGLLIAPWARAPKDENGEYADGSTGEYFVGGNKFDLDTFDSAYFVRLKDFVSEAGQRGIIVELTFFSIFYNETDYWNASPLKRINNINGIGDCTKQYALTKATEGDPDTPNDLLPVMYALIDKIVDELKGFDNVIYEACNEPYNTVRSAMYVNTNGEHCSIQHVSTEWQAHITKRIIAAQDSFPPAHLIAQNIYGAYDSVLVIATDFSPDSVDDFRQVYPEIDIYHFHYITNRRDWLHRSIEYNYNRLSNPIGCDETGQLSDGNGGYIIDDTTFRKQAWNFIVAGGSLYNNLDFSFTSIDEAGIVHSPVWTGGSQKLRSQYGILSNFIHGFDFLNMEPHLPTSINGSYNDILKGGLSSPIKARVLANVGEEYIIFIEDGTQVDLIIDMPSGVYVSEWLNTETGAIDKSEIFNHGGGERMIVSPTYSNDIALGIVQDTQFSTVSGLIGHWTFDDTVGITVPDVSGNFLTGYLVNGAEWDTAGKINGAVSCDGINDYIEIYDNDLLDPDSSDFTVSFWIYKRESNSGYDGIWAVNKWNTGAAPGTNEWLIASGGINDDQPFFGFESGTDTYWAGSSDNISLNEWHLLTGIREDTVIRMYVDSTLKETTIVGNAAVNNVGRNIRIANSQVNSLYANALYDDLRIYDRALSRAEIITLMKNQGASTNPSSDMSWSKTYGGTLNDYGRCIQQTFDSGYIAAGYTYSDDGDVHGKQGVYSSDYWIVKLTGSGDTVWTKSMGGTKDDFANSVVQTIDSGYAVAGCSNSSDGEVFGSHGSFDFWIAVLDSIGDTVWTKTYGGSSADKAYAIVQTTDNGFVVAGSANSNDGDVFGHQGYAYSSDFWVIKLNNNGDTTWTKTLGGTSDECAYSIDQTNDGGYIVAGSAESDDGDVYGNQGNSDYWIVRLTSSGDTLWTKTYGGTADDVAQSVQQTNDNGFIVAGYSKSYGGDVNNSRGVYDYWVLKLNTNGDTLWTKSFGGSLHDMGCSIQQTLDGGFIIAGNSLSNDKDVDRNQGSNDYWVVKIDGLGNLLWNISLGGSNSDEACCIRQTMDSGFIVAGNTRSTNGDVSGNHGENDFWIAKLDADLQFLETQTIPLAIGWNIMSFNVAPDDSNILSIVQPLIDSSELIKVIDEAGRILENIPGIGWLNTIGDIAHTEGYYIKVTELTQLQLSGSPVDIPFAIPLATGWNIMGYPLAQNQNALTAVQPLIDNSELIKVQDELGGFVQDIPGIGWMNTIGNFEPGEGYYIKVTDNTTLTLDNPSTLQFGIPTIEKEQVKLFKMSEKNPYLPMNIIVTGIEIDGHTIQTGDEVAVYDFNQIIGVGVIDADEQPQVDIVAPMDDPLTTTIDGFVEGDLPEFRYRSASLASSINLEFIPVFGSSFFAPLGTLVCTLAGSITNVDENKLPNIGLKCIPNPANDYTTIQYNLSEDGQVLIEVYDLSGHKLRVILDKQEQAGVHRYRFDASVLEKGIYLLKIHLATKSNQQTEVIKFVRS